MNEKDSYFYIRKDGIEVTYEDRKHLWIYKILIKINFFKQLYVYGWKDCETKNTFGREEMIRFQSRGHWHLPEDITEPLYDPVCDHCNKEAVLQ